MNTKKFSNQLKEKIRNILFGDFGNQLLDWLRLLVLSFTKSKKNSKKYYLHKPGEMQKLFPMPIAQNLFTYNTKLKIMKSQNHLIKWAIMLMLFLSAANAMAQGPYPNTGNQSVCLNTTEPYGVVLNAGSTYTWTVTPLASGNGTITAGATPNLITVNWTSIGTATLQLVETNSLGCPGNPVTIIVTVTPIPTLVVTNPAAVCAPGTVDITAAAITTGSTAGLTYTYWQDAAGTLAYTTPTTATANTYYIKGTSAGGCFDIKPVTVTVTPLPTIVITNPPAVCAPGTIDITAAAITTGSTAGLTFSYWQDAAGTVAYTTPTTATANTYYIKGTSAGGCADIKPVIVTVTPLPNLVITNPTAVCTPATVDITAAAITAGSTAGLTFTYWTDAAATIPFTTAAIATANTYYIKGTTAAGCAAIKPVEVNVNPIPTPVISGPSPICESVGGSTAIYSTPDVPGNSYAWVVVGGTISAGQGTNSIAVTWTTAGAGSVSVTESVAASGCSGNGTKAVTINPKPVTSPITHN